MNRRDEGLEGPYFNQKKRHERKGRLVQLEQIPGEKLKHRHHPVVRAIATVALQTSLIAAVADPFIAKFEADQTKQEVVRVIPSQNQERSDTDINIAAGFGLRNSVPIARALKAFSGEGNVLATIYNNEAIDGSELAHSLLEQAKEDKVKRMILFGDSMGGMISLEAAAIIQASDTDVSVPYIVLENSPSSYESVRPAQRENGQLLLAFTDIPFLSYSHVVQFGAGIAAKSGYYLGDGVNETVPWLPFNFTEFFATGFRVAGGMIDGNKVPSAELLGSQFSTIATSDVRDNIMKLGEDNERGKPKPVLILIRPTSDYSDQLVDSKMIEEQYRQYALEAGLRLIVIKMPSIVHGDPTQSQKQYAEIIPYIIEQVDKTNANPLAPSGETKPLIKIPGIS